MDAVDHYIRPLCIGMLWKIWMKPEKCSMRPIHDQRNPILMCSLRNPSHIRNHTIIRWRDDDDRSDIRIQPQRVPYRFHLDRTVDPFLFFKPGIKKYRLQFI